MGPAGTKLLVVTVILLHSPSVHMGKSTITLVVLGAKVLEFGMKGLVMHRVVMVPSTVNLSHSSVSAL